MNKLRILEVGQESWQIRQMHFKIFLESLQIQGVTRAESRAGESWDLFLKKHEFEHDIVSLGLDEMESCAIEYFRSSSKVRTTGVCDFLVSERGQYWPKIYLLEAFNSTILKAAPKLDTQSYAYIIGAGALAKLAVASLINFGFAKINIVAASTEDAQSLVSFLQTKYFGVSFQVVEARTLTMQPSHASVLVNTLSPETDSAILSDLYYLNFTRKEALIVDFNILPLQSNLITEAQHVGDRTLSGYEIFGRADGLLMEELLSSEGVTRESYYKSWIQFIDLEKSPASASNDA
jgi:hypothetical protein